MLSFVAQNPNLKQIYERTPQDTLFPFLKAAHEIQSKEDIQELVKKSDTHLLRQVIETLDERPDPKQFAGTLVGLLKEYDYELFKSLYRKVMKMDQKVMDDLMFNHFVWGAVNFKDRAFLVELMYTSSILDFKIDMQTYLKVQLGLYCSNEKSKTGQELDNTEYLIYFYQLFA